MCILFLAINQHPAYPLIVAANRDESFARPSLPMHYWQDEPHILAGRDTLKGGSWLGVNLAGQFCAVTNFRTGKPSNQQAKSRGQLVQQYLACENLLDEKTDPYFIVNLQKTYCQYNPFNIIFGNPENINIFCSEDASLHHLTDGFHSVSNGKIDQHWPKMSGGVQRLTELIDKHATLDITRLNAIMRDETKAGNHTLPNTGVSQTIEKRLSSIFIRAGSGIANYVGDYGTRTTSYLLYTPQHILIYEFNYDREANVTDQQVFTLNRVTNSPASDNQDFKP